MVLLIPEISTPLLFPGVSQNALIHFQFNYTDYSLQGKKQGSMANVRPIQ
jgi:hypothetical protein